jgi:hypothetical protein
MANPWESWPVTCDWACHVANHNSDLGTDLGCTVGTPIIAAFAGTLSNGTRQEPAPFKALYIAILRSDVYPNLSFEHMHLSRFAPPGHYNAGDVIGWTGGARFALGSGQATGPHLHVNAIINGHLAPIYQAFTEFASINVTPLINGGEDMARIIVITDGPEQNVTYLIAGGRLSLIQPLDQVALASALAIVDASGGTAAYRSVSGQQIIYIKALLGYGVAPVTVSDAQLAAIGAAVKVPTVDVSTLATGLAAIGAAVATVDEHVQAIRVPTKLTGTLG